MRERGTTGEYARRALTAPASTPGLALAYLRELSADVREGIVVDGTRLLAGRPELLAPALELLAGLGGAGAGEGRAAGGAVFAARTEGLAVVVLCGPRALSALTRHDLGLVLGDLGGHPAPGGPVAALPAGLVERLLSAAQRAPRP